KTLEKNGRRLLRQRLARLGRDELSDTELDTHVLDTTVGMFDKPYQLDWVYQQLGLLDAREQGAPLARPAIDAARADILAVDIANRIRSTSADSVWEIPTQF